MSAENKKTRRERDGLGGIDLPAESLSGIHTCRARENFSLAGRPVHPALSKAYGWVKLAVLRANREVGAWSGREAQADALERACSELVDGTLVSEIVVDALQGGAGTSTNMNVNEVLANRALQILGREPGSYQIIDPLDDVNCHQSTNDTYPTALKLAAIQSLQVLEPELIALQEAFQAKELEFAHVVKVGRTQLQDAVLTTLGREMSAYSEAINRDRWRLYKAQERLRVVNLGGTAIGTGLGAPRKVIFRATDILRELTGIPLARADNLVDATQNADVFVEVHGLLTACATSLIKIAGDLRLMSSGPEAGFGEIKLPAVQAGSSIMPGKVNPVIPEAVTQEGMKVLGNHTTLAQAVAAGSLELNPFLPLIADVLLESIDLLTRACWMLREKCVVGIEADEKRCRQHVESSTAFATALVPVIGYEKAGEVLKAARDERTTVRESALKMGVIGEQELDALLTPEAVMKLGY